MKQKNFCGKSLFVGRKSHIFVPKMIIALLWSYRKETKKLSRYE